MPLPTEDDYKLVNKNMEDAIANLVDGVRSDGTKEGGYSKQVYGLVWKLVEAGNSLKEVYTRKLTDLEEYKVEIERRRQIGLTIDPATAETMFWWADGADPYDILDQKYHCDCVGRELFARHPGGEWVDFADLPEATRDALWQRDGRKLSFPYGLNPGDDVINCPPKAEEQEAVEGLPEQGKR